jgi:RimJ/RimL family protein N-acetyltransferase
VRLALGIDDAVGAWVAARIPHIGTAAEFGPFVAVGVVDRADTPVAGVVWHGYRPSCSDIQLSAAASTARWLTRHLIAEIFAYPFLYLGCRRVTTITPVKGERALAVNLKIGFQMEGRVRFGFGTDDAIIMGLLREEWLSGRFAPSRPVMKEAA